MLSLRQNYDIFSHAQYLCVNNNLQKVGRICKVIENNVVYLQKGVSDMQKVGIIGDYIHPLEALSQEIERREIMVIDGVTMMPKYHEPFV